MGYPNLYVEQAVDDAYVDRLTRRAGFLTTSKTKPLIIDNLVHLLRQGESGVACVDLIDEMRTYVIDPKLLQMHSKDVMMIESWHML